MKLFEQFETHSRTKHIDVNYHYLREKAKDGAIQLSYVATSEQFVDILTKPLKRVIVRWIEGANQVLDYVGCAIEGGCCIMVYHRDIELLYQSRFYRRFGMVPDLMRDDGYTAEPSVGRLYVAWYSRYGGGVVLTQI